MHKLLESMDPQGLLNMAETEDATASAGVDPTMGGDAHADTHNVSLTDNGSESSSSACSTREKTGNQSETMEIGSPKFRIVDIEPRPSAAPTQQIQPSTTNESAARIPAQVRFRVRVRPRRKLSRLPWNRPPLSLRLRSLRPAMEIRLKMPGSSLVRTSSPIQIRT